MWMQYLMQRTGIRVMKRARAVQAHTLVTMKCLRRLMQWRGTKVVLLFQRDPLVA